MAILNITDLKTTKVGMNTLNNGTQTISIISTFPEIDSTFDVNLLEDLYIESLNGFKASETIGVTINGGTQSSFTISSDTKAIWLSELIGVTRATVLSKSITTDTIQFDFTSNKLLKFILVVANSLDFLSASVVQTSGLGSNMYNVGESDVSPKDENMLSALRDAINNTKTIVTNNNTNVITITNTYPTFGSALDKTLLEDALITFAKSLNIGTQIYIKKDGNHINTYITKSNLKYIWLSDLLNISSRDFLYQKTNEIYELTFVYDTQINCQIIAGELTNFPSASVAGMSLTQNLFELSNAKALANIPVETNNCIFSIDYDSYDNSIKSAKLKINEQQEVYLSFVEDHSSDIPKYFIKLSNVDNLYNISIDLVMDLTATKDYITIIRDFGRKLSELNATPIIPK